MTGEIANGQYVRRNSSEGSGPENRSLRQLATLFAIIGTPISYDKLRHSLGKQPNGANTEDIVSLAKSFDFQCTLRQPAFKKLSQERLPALAEVELDQNGTKSLILVGGLKDDAVLAADPTTGQPTSWPTEKFKQLWTGRWVEVAPPKQTDQGAAPPQFGFSWFLPVLMKFKHLIAQVAVASLLLQFFALATPLFFMLIMDKVLSSGALSTLDVLAIGLLSVGVFEFALGLVRMRLMAFITHRMDVELSARLFRHLSLLPASFFANRQTGRTTARVTEMQTVRSFLTGQAPIAIIDLLFTFVFIAVIFHFSPMIAIFVGIAMIAIFVVYGVVTPALRKRLEDKSQNTVENQSFLVETVFGMETVKSLAVEPGLQRDWERQMADQTASAERSEHLSQSANQSVTFLNRLTVVTVLWFGANYVLAGEMTAGQLIAVNMMTMRVLAPAQRVAQLWQQLHQTLISVQKLGEIMNAPQEPQGASESSLPNIEGAITFKDVSFSYRQDGPAALSDVSFEVAPGEVVGIVGPSGSGKSTVARLIQRLYWPQKGKILIDGVDLALVDPAWLRRKVGHVLQDPFLFNRSVRENIAFAEPTMSLDRVIEAAKLTGAHDFIVALPEAYDTVVGERGAKLSGGERQRIVLARALATDPRILILDEATSALDYEAERVIHENMHRICAGRTVFLIAHRLASIRHADRILVFEDGKITEQGSHEYLVANGGLYSRLDALQRDGQIKPTETSNNLRQLEAEMKWPPKRKGGRHAVPLVRTKSPSGPERTHQPGED